MWLKHHHHCIFWFYMGTYIYILFVYYMKCTVILIDQYG